MAITPARYGACSIAESTASNPSYHRFMQLELVRLEAEQPVLSSRNVTDLPFDVRRPTGQKHVRLLLEGLSDHGMAEQIAFTGFLAGQGCRVRCDTAHQQRIFGMFYVTAFVREAAVDGFERVRITLESSGEIAAEMLS